MVRLGTLLVLLLVVLALDAQPYVEGGNTRHRFAQFLLGADWMYFPAGGETYQLPSGNEVARYQPKAALAPRINLAGTHFWGHVNFYVSIPIANVLDASVPDGGEIDFNPGVETGFRLYPWRIERGKARPFVGTAFAMADWRQSSVSGRGAYGHLSRFPLQLGLTYQHRRLLFDFGVGRYFNNELTYYVDPVRSATVTMPRVYGWVGVNYQLETTLSAEPAYQSGRTRELREQYAREGALSGWSLAVGPSAAFVKGEAERNERRYPALGRHRVVNTFPEFGLGYYHYPWDGHLNLAFRANRSSRQAYGREQGVKRRSLALEAYKFLFDFHGFVPFLGPHVSREWLSLREREGGETIYEATDRQWAFGLTFGWDIRPDALQGIILRTNLRYTPLRPIGSEGGVSFSQVEFNFIQVVVYPGRMKRLGGE